MRRASIHECTNCGARVIPEHRNHRYAESGLSNVVLQGIEVADCPNCGNSDVIIPRMAKIHRAIAQAQALANVVAEHVPEISNESVWELHVDVTTLQTTFLSVLKVPGLRGCE